MKRNIMSLLVYLLIGLAVIGFITALFTNTVGFLTSIVLSLLIGAAIFGLVYFFILRKRTSNELRKYRKAVKQSKQKYKDHKKDATYPYQTKYLTQKNEPTIKE